MLRSDLSTTAFTEAAVSAAGQFLLLLDAATFTHHSHSAVSIGVAATYAPCPFGNQSVSIFYDVAELGTKFKKGSLSIVKFSRLMSSEEAVWSVDT
jgi:hypothetical protein